MPRFQEKTKFEDDDKFFEKAQELNSKEKYNDP